MKTSKEIRKALGLTPLGLARMGDAAYGPSPTRLAKELAEEGIELLPKDEARMAREAAGALDAHEARVAAGGAPKPGSSRWASDLYGSLGLDAVKDHAYCLSSHGVNYVVFKKDGKTIAVSADGAMAYDSVTDGICLKKGGGFPVPMPEPVR